MATVAEARENMERIEKALAQNVKSVTFADGRSVDFSTFEELVQRWHFWAQIAGEEGGRQRLLGEFTKGVKC